MGTTYAAKQVLSEKINSNLVISLGSSIYAQGLVDTSARFGYDLVGPAEWAMRLSGWRGRYLNRAISGQTTSQMLARVDFDVLRHNPGIVICQNGTNESATGFDAIKATSLELYNKILNRGSHLILIGMATRNKAESGWDDDNLRTMAALNEFKRRFAESHVRCHYVDVNKYIIDPTQTDGEPLAEIFRDGTHWTPKGAFLCGQAIAPVIQNLLPPVDVGSAYALKPDGTLHQYGNEVGNPTFEGSGGTIGTGMSGNVPDSWRLERVSGTTSGGGAATIAAVGGFDPRREVTITFTPGGGSGTEEFYFYTSPAGTSPINIDTYMEALMNIDVSAWDGWKNIQLEVDDQSAINKTYYDGSNVYDETMPDQAWNGVLRTPEFLATGDDDINADDQRFRIRIGIDSAASGTGVIKLHSPILRAVDPDPVLAIPRDVYVN